MALTKLTTSSITGDTLAAGDIAADAITASELADNAVDTAAVADNAVTLAKMASGTDGNIISYDASGNPVAIATGNDGQVLTSTGAGSPPAFEAAPTGGFVRLGGVHATGQNTGDINFDVFSSTYDLYYCQYSINFVADSSQLWCRVRNSSGYKTNAGYKYSLNGVNQSGTNSDINGNGDSKIQLSGGTVGNDGHHSVVGHFMFYRPYESSVCVDFTMSAVETDESYVVTSRQGGGSYQVAEQTTGFGFLGSNQNLENYSVQVYGLKKS